jgi:hypothetical protein
MNGEVPKWGSYISLMKRWRTTVPGPKKLTLEEAYEKNLFGEIVALKNFVELSKSKDNIFFANKGKAKSFGKADLFLSN